MPLLSQSSMSAYGKYAIAFATVLATVIVIHNTFSPPDWVVLHLVQVPPDVQAVYVIARDRQGAAPLKWYFSKFYPFLGSAKEVGEVWYLAPWGDQRKGDVQWRSVDSYGILARRESGEWVVWWLRPGDVKKPTPLRYLTGGGAEATIRATGIETATPAPRSLTNQIKP